MSCEVYDRTTDATSEPVTTAEMKAHMRIDHSDEDTEIDAFVTAARQTIEAAYDLAMFTQTWTLELDEWPTGDNPIQINTTPLQSVSSISYVDINGDSQTLATSVYTVDTKHKPGRVYLAYNQTWPNLRGQRKAVTITYLAGYAATASIPDNWKTAVMMLAADYFENREAGNNVPFTFKQNPTYDRLIGAFRMRPFIGAA